MILYLSTDGSGYTGVEGDEIAQSRRFCLAGQIMMAPSY